MSFAELKSARRRCVAMGKAHGWVPEFNSHPLAACLDNHTACIDAELEEAQPDHLAVLCWIQVMARKVNAYCDAAKVAGDRAAEYWLERFLWRCDRVVELERV